MSADHEKSLVKNEMSEEKMNQDETDVTEFCNVELKESNCGTTTESPKKNAEYQCVMCSETFDGEDNLRLHMEAEHAKETEKYSTLIEEYPEWFYETNNTSHLPNMDNDIKQVECDICMAKFSRKSNLTRHLKRKHPENTSEDKYKCSESGCLFQTNFKLPFQVHLKKHHGIKPFECDICKKKFSEKVNMLRHRIIHSDVGPDKEYKCPECSYQTNYKERLALHLNNHNPVKAFACDICTEKFTQRRNLQAHVKNKHSTVRKYKCPDCSYQSNNSSNFKLHLNMHNEVKPFECDICKKKFASKYSLKVHKKDKHAENGTEKKYKCTKTGCSYQTYFKQSLTLHVNKHNKIKPFDCNICKKKFTQKRHLNVHIKNKHSENTTKAK